MSDLIGENTMNGAERIAAERKRQQEAEGWTQEHDREHDGGELLEAAICYAITRDDEGTPLTWPWDDKWWKPSHDPVRNLERAGALIAAEIDRLLAERNE